MSEMESPPTNTENPLHPLTNAMISENISLLARTGNGLSFAYTKLEIHGQKLTDLDALESFPHLRYIDLSENALVNIYGLSHLEYLLSLDVHDNQLTEVPSSIDRRKYLQHANFSKNKIQQWNISRWPMLTWLNLNDNQLKELNFNDCSELIHLEVRNNQLESIGVLQAPKLQRLYLAANQLKALSGLENKPQLNLLHLRGNFIESLSGLNELKKLTYLNLRGNRITEAKEVEKLSELPLLRVLVLSGNPVDQIANYRIQVISRLMKLDRLDKDLINQDERDEALQFQMQSMQTKASELDANQQEAAE